MKTRAPSAAAEPSITPGTPDVLPPVTGRADGSPTGGPASDGPSTSEGSGDEPGSRDPRDHDADGRMGGAAPAPEVQHLVVLVDDAARGLTAGEVLAVSPDDAGSLLVADVVRDATPQEVELASPRIRSWVPAA